MRPLLISRILHKKNNNKGFTLAELLLTVAIIIVLLAVAFVAIIEIQKNLRQKELDSKAEIIYEAAQNQLTKMKATGDVDNFSIEKNDDVHPLGIVPSDSNDANLSKTLYYVVSDFNTDNGTAERIVNKNVIDEGLWNKYWVIEYNPSSGSVYAVFYTEDEAFRTYTPSNWDLYRGQAKNRIRMTKAKVGYYGGEAVSIAPVDYLQPTIKIENGEVLRAIFHCDIPTSDKHALQFKVTITDEYGNEWSKLYDKVSVDPDYEEGLEVVGYSYTLELVLDSLIDSKDEAKWRFANKFDSLVAGTPINIKLEVISEGPYVSTKAVEAKTNSLFADESTKETAYITCGRHLQNLDASTGTGSGVNEANPKSAGAGSTGKARKVFITNAIQKSDISFYDKLTDDKDWASEYPNLTFKPITNNKLNSYTGSFDRVNSKRETQTFYTSIYGLNIDSDNAALFGVIPARTDSRTVLIEDVKITVVKANGNSTAASLVGDLEGKVKIKNCCAYLEADKDGISGTGSRIYAPICGGLIGKVEETGEATIIESSASTVIGKKYAVVGGLIGSNSGYAELEKSYADCYLRGQFVGGLVGNTPGSDVARIKSCFAAGYIDLVVEEEESGSVAGFVNGVVKNMTASYSVMSYSDLNENTNIYTTAWEDSNANHVYFNTQGIISSSGTPSHVTGTNVPTAEVSGFTYSTMTGENFAALLSYTEQGATKNDFTGAGESESNPYNLRNQGLTGYAYPGLKNLKHYGDYQAEFESGNLVYFEKYTNDKYGFYGANVDCLSKAETVVGDGYGIVFEEEPQEVISIKFNDAESTVEINPNDGTTLKFQANGYWVVALPKSINDTSYTGAFMQKLDYSDKTFYFNPHFAKTVSQSNAVPSTIEINSARQLYNLSMYYDKYQQSTRSSTFVQNRDVDYADYDWTGFTSNSSAITRQKPIGSKEGTSGMTETVPFDAKYDGRSHIITGVNIEATTETTVGLFEYNKGTISNVVLVAEADAGAKVKRNDVNGDSAVYMGVLCGYNAGNIENCAVAGYEFKGSENNIKVSDRGRLYVGTLVGGNAGTIVNCSAESPSISVTAVNSVAALRAGGFTGANLTDGTIDNCYAIATLTGTDSTTEASGNIVLAGFASSNDGKITNSYCAAPMVVSGDSISSYGFSPDNGTISGVKYLDGATFNFLEAEYSYTNSEGYQTKAKATYNELEATTDKAESSHYHTGTGTTTDNYPFRAVVKKDGKLIHYGDWCVPVLNLPQMGMFYWEKEGEEYHFSFVGSNASGITSGNDLCLEHDDEKSITDFGYGYFTSDNANTIFRSLNETALTIPAEEDNSAATAAATYLTGIVGLEGVTTCHAYKTDATSGLKILDNSTNAEVIVENDKYKFTFEFNPFFADSFQLKAVEGMAVDPSTLSGVIGKHSYKPGTVNNSYGIRSIAQLQFINWNYATQNVITLVDENNKDTFNYLSNASSSKADLYWEQTHDLNGTGITDYVPIAGMSTSTTADSEDNTLHAWFGGHYDGHSFMIKNLPITSNSFTVGLFGVTDGAELKNIIMYSDESSEIKRADAENKVGMYAIGGLVGVAYGSDDSDKAIDNCSIGGYKITDASSNQQGLGEANIGGLVGISKVGIKNSSAVCDIVAQPTFTNGTAKNGVFIRVGGLVGACEKDITNCYTGGSINVPEEVQNVDISYTAESVYKYQIYLSGIAGSCYVPGFGEDEAVDGEPHLNNCYTYMTFPEIATFKAREDYDATPWVDNDKEKSASLIITVFASVADRAIVGKGKVVLNNCYYLDTIRTEDVLEVMPVCTEVSMRGITALTAEQMSVRKDAATKLPEDKKIRGFDCMADALNDGNTDVQWSNVTIEAGSEGKYSFPANATVVGEDYPYPTIVDRTDFADNTKIFNVHYGAWPAAPVTE